MPEQISLWVVGRALRLQREACVRGRRSARPTTQKRGVPDALSNGVYYLAFSNGTPFGYYAFLSDDNYLYHFDLGYEYVFDVGDSADGVYLYDFARQHFFYTSPTFPFPYLYDFSLKAVLYYYPEPTNAGHYTTNPRYFYNFSTNAIITQ